MQQVVLFSSDFEKESAECLKKGLNKIHQLNNQDEKDFQYPYQKIEIDISEPQIKLKEIIERYKGLILGLPPEWFHLNERLEVTIIQKNIQIKGKPSSLLFMPKQGTPVRLVVNDDYAHNNTLSIFFITNINFGDQESIISFQLTCDEKIVRLKGNIDLLNIEIEEFNKRYKEEMLSHHKKQQEEVVERN